jgi:hypothetical protein
MSEFDPSTMRGAAYDALRTAQRAAKEQAPESSGAATCSARKLAELIAVNLFITGLGDRGTRLEIKQGDPHGEEISLGGWCLAAAIHQIQQVIEQNVSAMADA